MELKFVIPNMEKTFGNLEFAGEDKTEQRRINGRMAVFSRSFNLYSDVVIRQIKRCRFHQIKTGLSEHLTMG